MLRRTIVQGERSSKRGQIDARIKLSLHHDAVPVFWGERTGRASVIAPLLSECLHVFGIRVYEKAKRNVSRRKAGLHPAGGCRLGLILGRKKAARPSLIHCMNPRTNKTSVRLARNAREKRSIRRNL